MVVVIDDDSTSRESIRELIELAGYRVVALGNAARAADVIPALHPSVIVTDLSMPGMSGAELVDRLREGRRSRWSHRAGHLLVTGDAEARVPEGAQVLFRKPLRARAFAEVVKSLCLRLGTGILERRALKRT
jgi:CheY-like chemotaxis protein